MRGEGDGAVQRGAERGKASAEQRGGVEAAQAAAAADARGEGDGAEQCGAKQGEASAEQRGGAKAAEAAEAEADARGEGKRGAARRRESRPSRRSGNRRARLRQGG